MQRLHFYLFLALSGLILLLVTTFFVATGLQEEHKQQQAYYHAQKLSQYINSELTRFQEIPELVSSNYMIRQALSGHPVQGLNHLLLEIAHSSGSDHEVYVMDTKGNVIASSNYQTPQSFIGSNFAFRPYFQKAASGNVASYYALGLKSRERGIFFSAPVVIQQEIKGVVTFKMEIARFEQDSGLLAGKGDNRIRFLAWGEDQVIFMSNHLPWQLKQIQQSDAISWSEIHQSRRYPELNQQIIPGFRQASFLHQTPLWFLSDTLAPSHTRSWIYQQADLPVLKMKLAVLVPEKKDQSELYILLILTASGYLILLLSGSYIWRRLAGYHQLLYTRKALEQEISVRTAELETTRDALVQAARLATIGQLSASINHEINQPLSAISTYLITTQRMLDKGMTDQARANLTTLSGLVNRVHSIVAQLKQFSRQSESRMDTVSLQDCLDHALTITGPQIKKQGVQLNRSDCRVTVMADQIRLEQVLVNLLSNACDAMATHTEHQTKILDIEIDNTEAQWVIIRIADTGPGIDLQTIDTIFDPFFTTKSEHGLGLGLSVSRNIIHSFHGELSAENRSDQDPDAHRGAIFTIRLKQDTSE